ncbi:hypothetical protein [Sporosarcina sp. NPDC096371]|uniref:hypothetical protein n=1 Tax=Sporosarcina sp. NPDC096371 TaxID=3364530 RepID=UPI003820EB63
MKNEKFPFLSVETIKRVTPELEDKRCNVAAYSYNWIKMDKTKGYHIHDKKHQRQSVQDASSMTAKSAQEGVHFAPSTEGKMPLAITKENKSIKKEHVENDLDVVSDFDYLNDKASKQFKASSKVTV